ncbi:hypothetical protein ABIE88_006258 [Bradyrhizobium diazoefficiens]|uniref:hypothetical protein n=1 Tax=Bradyrhizobium diazoefficiens TaxID=1355477 RepID=UPI0035145DDE
MNQAPILRVEQPKNNSGGKVQSVEEGWKPGSAVLLSSDFAEWPMIPAPVRDKLLSLRDVKSDRHAALTRVSDDRRDALTQLNSAEARLAKLNSEQVDKRSPGHPDIARSQDEIKRFGATATRLTARYDELQLAWQTADRLVRSSERYLLEILRGDVSICVHSGDLPSLKNGETALVGLDRVAQRVRSLQQDRKKVLGSPFPTSMAKELAREQIAKRVEASRPDVSDLVDCAGAIEFPFTRAALQQYGGSAGVTNVIDPIGLLAWLFPKEFHAAIDREIDAAGDDEHALSPDERIAKLAEIASDILAAEREEVHFAELAGLSPRFDIDPRAVLGLASDMPAPKGR